MARRQPILRKRPVRAVGIEPLERRALMAGGRGVFAQIAGQVPARGVESTRFLVDVGDFTLPRDRVMLGLVADAEGSGPSPGRIRLVQEPDRRVAAIVERVNLTLASMTPGEYAAIVAPRSRTHGSYNLSAFLAGDANADYRVDGSDLAIIRTSGGARRGGARYRIGADVNRDGVINGLDLRLARRNLGVATSLRPIVVTAALDVVSDPEGDGRVTTDTVTVSGHTRPGALIRVDAGADGTTDELVSADVQGNYRFALDAALGINAVGVTALDTFGQSASARLTFSRVLSSSITDPQPPVQSVTPTLPIDPTQPVTPTPPGTPTDPVTPTPPTPPGTDTQPPTIVITSPSSGQTVTTNLTIAGRVADGGSGVASLIARVDDGPAVAVPFDAATSGFGFTTSLTLDGTADGPHRVQLAASDAAGNLAAAPPLAFTLDTQPPTVVIQSPGQNFASRSNPTIAGRVADATSGVTGLVAQVDAGDPVALPIDATGAFRFTPSLAADGSADGAHTVRFTATDATGQLSQPATLAFRLDRTAVPDPATVAPTLTTTTTTSLLDATSFLYTGPDAVQIGVDPGTISPQQAAVVRGRVLGRDGAPVAGATITVLSHPEYGLTYSRADGMLDLAVNGGGPLTVEYAKAGFLPIQRQVDVPWQDYSFLPDVVLSPLDAQATTIDLASAEPFQVARGTVQADGDGVRQATLLFPQGVQATMTLPDGTTRALSSLDVRATEYTVGPDGPKAMPGALPPTSGYTYAVELSVDAALAAGADRVDFDRPVPFYVENFLSFPVGMAVPAGYYDRGRGQWIAAPNGRVIRILAEPGGVADLDIDGDGQADTASALAVLGVGEAERIRLAFLYEPGQSLWRVPITHFTPWDCNWPFGPPGDAQAPDVDEDDLGSNPEDDPDEACGSVIGVQNQTLGESISIAGTPFSLVYSSDRVPGSSVGRSLTIPLTRSTVPSGVKRVDLTISVGGRQFAQSFDPSALLSAKFTWDGNDVYGRRIQGTQAASVSIGYVYDAVYYAPAIQAQSFGVFSGIPITGNRARQEITLHRNISSKLQYYTAAELGGWSLVVQHVYDPVGHILHRGDGQNQSRTGAVENIVTTVAGNGKFTNFRNSGDGGPATQAGIDPSSIAMGPDGNLYIVSDHQIRRVGPDGIITTIAGNGKSAYSGDGGPALQAGIDPEALAIGPDGSLYLADGLGHSGQRIRRIAPDGIISTIAGDGTKGSSGGQGDGGPATQAKITGVFSIAISPEGVIYLADSDNSRIRRIGTDGIIATVAGNGQFGIRGLGGAAVSAQLGNLLQIALGPDGSLYIADGSIIPDKRFDRILRVGTNGIITKVAGNGQSYSYSGDGKPANATSIPEPTAIAVAPDGTLYIALAYYRILRINANQIVTTIAGNGTSASSIENGPATADGINPLYLTLGPDGGIYAVDDQVQRRVRRISSALPSVSGRNVVLPSQDGSQLFEFDYKGRHLKTLNALTSTTIYAFGYDPVGRLISVIDGDGNVTSIERDASGNPTAIVAPYGQRTSLTLNGQGYLASVADPAGDTTFGYGTGGLLTSMTDPRKNTSTMAYDASGRLVRDENATDGFTQLDREELGGGSYKVTTTNAVNGKRQYLVERLADGSKRRTVIDGRGFATVTLERNDGTRETTSPDGTKVTAQLGPDPRFGMLAPLASAQTVATPAGVKSAVTSSRVATYGATVAGVTPLATLMSTVTIDGKTTTSVYNAAARTITSTSLAGRTSVTILDAKGRVILVHVPGVADTSFVYDIRGRLERVTQDERSVSYSYDARGRLETITDPLDRSVTFAYDTADRLTRQTQPDESFIAFAYDANGNMIGLTPPGKAEHTFGYDASNRLDSVTPPSTGAGDDTTRYIYNLAGQVIEQSLPGGTSVLYAYCDCGRLNSITTPLGTYGYTYSDKTGVLTSLSSPGGTQLDYGYDGALLTSVKMTGPVTGTVAWTYNVDFQITSESVNGGNTVNYGYDKDGLLTQAGELTLTRDTASGFLTGTTLGTVTDTLAYNGYGEVSGYQARTGQGVVFADDFTRDKLGRITRKVETIGGVMSTTEYGYDWNDRLETVTENGVLTQRYGYDANGNRLNLTTVTNTVTGTYDAQDRLLTYGTKTYSYTPLGQLLQVTDTATGETTHYGYDVFGNTIRVDLPTGRTIEYLTDGQDRRIGKKVDGVLTEGLIYSGQLQPVARTDGAGNIVERFVYGTRINVPEYMFKGGITYRFITDHLGSVRLIIDSATGQIAQRIDYDAFGNMLIDTNPGFQPFGFAGGIFDRDTNLTRFGVRDYNSSTGSWTNGDLIIYSVNNWNYSSSDPINNYDTNGLFSESTNQTVVNNFTAVGAAIGAILGGTGGGFVGAPTGPGAAVTASYGAMEGAAAGGLLGNLGGRALCSISSSGGNRSGRGDSSNFKSRDALRRSNEDARNALRQAMKENGIDQGKFNDLADRFHDVISGQGYDKSQLLREAREFLK